MSDQFFPPDLTDEKNENQESLMTWTGHLTELRGRILKTLFFFILFFVCKKKDTLLFIDNSGNDYGVFDGVKRDLVSSCNRFSIIDIGL